ncbi:MAG: RluA family pseudouridine synthase [Candidatus Muiribacteriota bacterium]
MKAEIKNHIPYYYGERIDIYLKKELLTQISRSKIQKFIKEGKVIVSGKKVKSNYILREYDVIEYSFEYNKKNTITGVNLNIPLIYEDEFFVVLNKPRGIVVHPAESVKEPTVLHHLVYKNISLAPVSLDRPGVVHRIDRYTSGLLIVAKTVEAYEKITELFKYKKILKLYKALCYNKFKYPEGIIDMPVGRNEKDRKKMAVKKSGKQAVTHYRVIEEFNNYSLIELNLKTGRTHQIRVHLAQCGHPVVGDGVYGPAKNEFNLTGQFLHACLIEFNHPFKAEKMLFESEMPEELANVIGRIKDENF